MLGGAGMDMVLIIFNVISFISIRIFFVGIVDEQMLYGISGYSPLDLLIDVIIIINLISRRSRLLC